MKKVKLFVLVLSVLLILGTIVLLGYFQLDATQQIPIYSKVISNGFSETIACWQNENGDYYLFLPGYADLSQISICKDTSIDVYLDGRPLVDGMTGESLQYDHPYELTYSLCGKETHSTLTVMRSGGIPTMYIDTLSGSMDYIHEEKGNKESAAMRLYDASGRMECNRKIESINGRGNSTWSGYEKKPYSLTLDLETDLLGMGQAKEWILIANAADASNIRNKLVYDFASKFGLAYSPDSMWVDLYLNGSYAGLYLLCERNEVQKNRVDISEDGSLISLELESRLQDRNLICVRTDANQTLRVHYPSIVDAEILVSLDETWQAVENAILSEEGVDPTTGQSWSDLIDVESWAKKYLIEEVFGNIDGGFISQYFYMDGNGKVFSGPVWDYDYAIGNEVLWQLTASNIQLVNKLNVNTDIYRPWFYALCQKEEFREQVLSVYQYEFIPLLKTTLSDDIDEYVDMLSLAASMNSVRWVHDRDWSEAVEYVISYMNERVEFFNKLWLEGLEFRTVCLHSRDIENNAYQMVVYGESISDLPVLKDNVSEKFLGWYYVDTDEPFNPTTPIYENTDLYAKWEKIPVSGTKKLVKIMPIAVFAMIFVVLFCMDMKNNVRCRRR